MNKITIGRDPDSTIVISEDYDIVSNEHADIEVSDNGEVFFIDHSSNGTTINGQKIQNRSMKISPTDNIMLAGVRRLEWSEIRKFIRPVGRPTVDHNIRSNYTPTPDDFDNYAGQQTQRKPQQDGFSGHSRPTDLHRNPAYDRTDDNPDQRWNGSAGYNGNQSQGGYVWPAPTPDPDPHRLSMRDQRELAEWNWGAFFFGWLWGVSHKVYWALAQLGMAIAFYVVDIVVGGNVLMSLLSMATSLAFSVWLGMKGTRMAWDAGAWAGMDHMRRSRSNWNMAALVCFCALMLIILLATLLFADLLLQFI